MSNDFRAKLSKRLAKLGPADTTLINDTTFSRVISGQFVTHEPLFDFLYAFGWRNRHNTKNVLALYVSNVEELARHEFNESYRKRGVSIDREDVFIFRVGVTLGRVLDLTNDEVVFALGLKRKDLLADWETAARPTKTQILANS